MNWQTASELNSDYFEIERSTDNIDWTPIGKVIAAGNSNDIRNYQFDDSQLSLYIQQSSTLYYRLKQVDKDGAITNSSIVTLKYKTKQSAITLYPLPINATLTATSNNNEIINEISLYDMSGRLLLSGNSEQLNSATLAQGIYIVKVVTDKQTYIQKVTKE